MSLGTITVDLLARTGSFTTDLDRASKQAKRRAREIDEAFVKAGKAIGLALAAGATAAGYAFKQTVDRMDDLSKAAQRASMPTEDFSRLAYAADLADVSMQDLQGSMGKLARAQGDAARGLQEQVRAFEALGIAYKNTDGSLKNTREVFFDFADKFQQFKGSPEIVALGMQIFGRSFQNLIPLLKDGATGLREAAAEADAFGVTLSTQAGQRAEEFNDNLTRLTKATQGFLQVIAADALDPLKALTDELVAVAKETKAVEEAAKIGTTGLQILATGAVGTGAAFMLAGESIAAVVTALRLVIGGEFKAAAAALDISADEIESIINRTKKLMSAIWDPPKASAGGSSGTAPTGPTNAPRILGIGGNKTGEDKIAAIIDSAIQRDFERMRSLREEADAFEAFIAQLLADDEAKLRSQADAWRDLIDPTRAYMRQLEEIRALVASGYLSPADGIAAEFAVQSQMNDDLLGGDIVEDTKAATDAARELGLTFSSAFEDAIVDGKKFSDVLKGLGQDITRIFIRKSITEPLANSIAGSLNLGSLFGGGKASGGPVSAGTTYLVGERGPELFTPKTSGAIVPNHQLGAPMTFAPTLNVYGEMSRTQEARLMAMMQNVAAGTVHQMKRQRQIA